MKILVTFAVGMEFATWRRQHDFRQVAHEPFPVFAAEIGGSAVRVVLTGIGTAAAAEAMRAALAAPADICISSGFVGALNPALSVGNVIAARLVLRAGRELAVASDRELLSMARHSGARQVDCLLTSEQMVTTAEHKVALASDADAVDMESFEILAEAARRGVRALALRVVSDEAGVTLPYNFDKARDERGRLRMGILLAEIARQPQRIPALLRLARDCRSAAGQLADFLDGYLRLVHARMDHSESEMMAAT